jgi:uncharacterized protein (DUF2141 family)
MLKKTFGVLSVSVCLAVSARAATFIVPGDRDMVRRADAIVVGAALASYSQMIDGRIETVTSYSIHEVIKGSVGFSIDIHEPGGRVGDQITFIPGVPRFEAGEESILFLTRTPHGTWAVTDIALGRFVFRPDQAGRKLALRVEGEIHGWDPDGSPHRESYRVAARFLDFLRTEARGGPGRANYFVETRPLTIAPNVLQPRTNTVYSATSYTSDVFMGVGARWSGFPTAVSLYTGGGTPASGVTATNAAIAAWDGDPNANVRYQNLGSAACPNSGAGACLGLAGTDGVNTILFERDLTPYGAPAFTCPGNGSYSGVLGVGGITSAGSTHSGPNGETFYTNLEVDVEMNVNVLGCVALGQGNINSAVTHEVGHTLGFRHSDQTRANDPLIACTTDTTLDCEMLTAIMRSSVSQGLNGTLQPYDQRAVRAVYPCFLGGGCKTAKNDFNGDGKSDILLRDSGGSLGMWLMNGSTITTGASVGSPGGTYTVAGIGDFNGDGKADILLRDALGNLGMWIMNGSTITSGASVGSPGGSYTVAGIGDFNGDGKADILLRDTLGNLGIWFMNGATITSGAFVGSPGGSYTVAGVGDFNGDGKADILLRDTLGNLGIWFMNGSTISSGAFVGSPGGSYTVAGVGDFNGDGKADILLRDTLGNLGMWIMNGSTITSGALVGSPGGSYTVAATNDYNGDGKADILLRDSSGNVGMWIMNGSTITSGALVGSPGSGYTIY